MVFNHSTCIKIFFFLLQGSIFGFLLYSSVVFFSFGEILCPLSLALGITYGCIMIFSDGAGQGD